VTRQEQLTSAEQQALIALTETAEQRNGDRLQALRSGKQ
jgi:hypothetical protein